MRIGLPVRIMAAAVLLTLGLVGLVVREGVARAQGREVLLPIEAYDPRSVLSGHYVEFQVRDRLPAGTPCPPGVPEVAPPKPGWIALAPAGGRHRAVGMADSRAGALKLGPVAVRGRLSCAVMPGIFGRPPGGAEPPRLATETLEIGVHRFHIDQAQAEAMAKALTRAEPGTAESLAVVSVGRDGKARLKGVVIDGARTDLDWF